jgi:hypothetical protein
VVSVLLSYYCYLSRWCSGDVVSCTTMALVRTWLMVDSDRCCLHGRNVLEEDHLRMRIAFIRGTNVLRDSQPGYEQGIVSRQSLLMVCLN